jgi:hypothetical protein
MESDNSLHTLAARAKEEFASVPHPGSKITVEGCCEEHDAWNKWCGAHSADEFLDAIREGGFDPFEFGGLSLLCWCGSEILP